MDIPGHLFRQHLFTEHLLGPGTVLGTGDTGVNENERFLSLMAFTLYWGRETTSYIARKQNISNSFRIQSAVKKKTKQTRTEEGGGRRLGLLFVIESPGKASRRKEKRLRMDRRVLNNFEFVLPVVSRFLLCVLFKFVEVKGIGN